MDENIKDNFMKNIENRVNEEMNKLKKLKVNELNTLDNELYSIKSLLNENELTIRNQIENYFNKRLKLLEEFFNDVDKDNSDYVDNRINQENLEKRLREIIDEFTKYLGKFIPLDTNRKFNIGSFVMSKKDTFDDNNYYDYRITEKKIYLNRFLRIFSTKESLICVCSNEQYFTSNITIWDLGKQIEKKKFNQLNDFVIRLDNNEIISKSIFFNFCYPFDKILFHNGILFYRGLEKERKSKYIFSMNDNIVVWLNEDRDLFYFENEKNLLNYTFNNHMEMKEFLKLAFMDNIGILFDENYVYIVNFNNLDTISFSQERFYPDIVIGYKRLNSNEIFIIFQNITNSFLNIVNFEKRNLNTKN